MPEFDATGEALLSLLGLKTVLRKGWTRYPISDVESVADHSYGVALLSWLLCPEGLDRGKVLELAVLHDLAEVVTGDLTPADGVPEKLKKEREREALQAMLQGFPLAAHSRAVLLDYQEQSSDEARFVKAIDKLEMALQSLLYERAYHCDLAEFRRSAQHLVEEAGLACWLEAV